MIPISICISLAYLFLIGSFVYGFNKVKRFKLQNIPAKTKFSIIIPFRNEVENLPELLNSIFALEYPNQLYEIILVDDHSKDGSKESIQKILNIKQVKHIQLDIRVIQNERKTNSPKKDAITTAIKQIKYEWIITSDADCVLPKFWLNSFDQFIQKTNAKCIAAPIIYTKTNSFLSRFQLADLLSLQGATIGGFGIRKPFLCNGANFAYQKRLFNELNGFEGNTHIASGDDIFFLEKATIKHSKNIEYLKCSQAIVTTKPQLSYKDLISQRLRWAAKTSSYNNWFGKLTGAIVLLANALVITLLLLSILSSMSPNILLYVLVIKLNIDFILIYKTADFFNQKAILRSFLVAFILYPFFSVYVVFLSTFKSYKWKGRYFKK
ncbi:glycosyltransferase [Pseudalgibacter alginicilyticus]|uniref:Glycosyltransferase n=1 Tax=Pseudalgibacter alginicilyticus TaxID=1736674 RepID=A0A0P0CZ96_9FLAO|nr:glycosyltransferase [Pseudalgibacter alginicilyticus]ALJ05951.1 glycosyltransferase [Pseudalgibacter alginicilyticus]